MGLKQKVSWGIGDYLRRSGLWGLGVATGSQVGEGWETMTLAENRG